MGLAWPCVSRQLLMSVGERKRHVRGRDGEDNGWGALGKKLRQRPFLICGGLVGKIRKSKKVGDMRVRLCGGPSSILDTCVATT